ncbi:MAG TPA: 2-oxoacid:acceptor oxidoreductase family protein, partial [Syntrophales bacterium]|nr:2-oxoacid:acceptor oxidoreductase family protein [Syntrophales bacterium]
MKEKKDFSIVLCGEAGQGIQTVEQILTRILKKSGYHIFGTKEYMSRVRGGTNSTLIRVSSAPVAAPVDRIDLLVPLDDKALSHLDGRISTGTMIIGDPDVIKPGAGMGVFHPVPLAAMAEAAGGALYGNTTAAGVVAGLFD